MQCQKPYDLNFKLEVVRARLGGMKLQDVLCTYGVSEGTFYRWFYQYKPQLLAEQDAHCAAISVLEGRQAPSAQPSDNRMAQVYALIVDLALENRRLKTTSGAQPQQ